MKSFTEFFNVLKAKQNEKKVVKNIGKTTYNVKELKKMADKY